MADENDDDEIGESSGTAKERGGDHIMMVVAEASSWEEENGCYGNEQGMNEIVGGGVSSSRAKEVLQ
ncbi:hypothetical protein TIFTF001_016226 [Ficus carica]|uniref:Uncharacterized protein n=1 Tax=Ficus carica TaxID=3494 RepID=A0AA88A752_FICCA|nr:hypothetical protein TIFTF001_016226 [Ficus carica]